MGQKAPRWLKLLANQSTKLTATNQGLGTTARRRRKQLWGS